MKYGYIRVSSKSQKDNYSIKEQRDLVLAAGADEVIEEIYTGGKVSERPLFSKLIARLQPSDTLRGLSTVFIGAFESIRVKKDADTAQKIGFVSQEEQQRSREITEEDLREYGVLNELLGRISAICNTNPIAEEDCLKIIHNSNSRIGTVSRVLSQYNLDPWKDLSDNSILEIIRSADIDKMGVRSVLTKIENIMMDSVYNVGLYKPQGQSPKPSL